MSLPKRKAPGRVVARTEGRAFSTPAKNSTAVAAVHSPVMDRPERLRLTACRCQCAGCGDWFASTRAFDRHRTGEYSIPGTSESHRRCLSLSEMCAAGWKRNERGFLLMPAATGGKTDWRGIRRSSVEGVYP